MSERASTSSVIHLLVTSVLTIAVLALTFIVVKNSAERAAEKTGRDETKTPEKAATNSASGEDQEPQLLTIVDQNIKPINFDQPAKDGKKKERTTVGRLKLQSPVANTLELNGDDIRNGFVMAIDKFPTRFTGGQIWLRAHFKRTDRETPLSRPIAPIESKTPAVFRMMDHHISQIADQGEVLLTAIWMASDPDKTYVATSEPLRMKIDTKGPLLQSAGLGTVGRTGATVELQFADDDFIALTNDHIQLHRVLDNDKVTGQGNPTAITTSGRTMTLEYGALKAGLYRISLTAAFEDRVGNKAGGVGAVGRIQTKYFSITPGPAPARHVQFPEFLPTARQPETKRRANAGDRVETAVVRLFYFRDAHRVAKLVNRTSRALNQAAVTLTQRRAATARDEANRLQSERQEKERAAVIAAQELRRQESELRMTRQSATSLLNQMDSTDKQIKRLQTELNAADGTNGGRSRREIEQDLDYQRQRKKLLQARLDLLKTSATGGAGSSENEVESARQRAIQANEEALQAQRQEDLARKDQFRREVSAGTANPDTYAAAQLRSVDPVAQVSVSVIGEGLVQLRGPRKGIDKIRTMIHQIDAPVGQVKVEVITVQINGEKGERMEGPLGKVEAHIGLGRFLTAQSLMLLRKAIHQEAAQLAASHTGGHYQVDRDRRYLYAFFGRDFVDELYAMDSEFLKTQNKLLSLHSMDTISLHRALFILALAKNDVRRRILANFMEKVRSDLVQAEFDYRRSSELFPHKTKRWLSRHDFKKISQRVAQRVARNAAQRYHFRSAVNFFRSLDCASGESMNPVQREFIRLAQIFKSRLVAELALRQRIIERTLTEDQRSVDVQEEEATSAELRRRVLFEAADLQKKELNLGQEFSKKLAETYDNLSRELLITKTEVNDFKKLARTILQRSQNYEKNLKALNRSTPKTLNLIRKEIPVLKSALKLAMARVASAQKSGHLSDNAVTQIESVQKSIVKIEKDVEDPTSSIRDIRKDVRTAILNGRQVIQRMSDSLERHASYFEVIQKELDYLLEFVDLAKFDFKAISKSCQLLLYRMKDYPTGKKDGRRESLRDTLNQNIRQVAKKARAIYFGQKHYKNTKTILRRTRRSLERRKLLDFLIEEQEKKVIDLLEGTRAHIASMDNYLKRLAIALEDDFKLQFYDPAFVRIRRAARQWDVTLGQVERTSILTNNRAFAKVSPAATMEFDLPKRKIAIVESFDAAKALMKDYGALMQDPTFMQAYQLMGGKVPNGKVQNTVPGLPSAQDEQQMGLSKLPQPPSGSALQGLVPDPSIYKFETGTGFEIRPVIQPDGHSIAYDFLYLYTTNVREPAKADEKHLGRIRRHFIRTQVQTSSFELRELSRYQVALKASRTAQGVPLLQDIPGVGMLFRPLPSAESSIQQNVILSKSVVYPTLFELMGLRWAPSIVDLSHVGVRDQEHVTRGRRNSLEATVFDQTSRFVDNILDVEHQSPEHYRPDLYHRQRRPSFFHPGGYIYNPKRIREDLNPILDPSRSGFEHKDRRPIGYRDPPYDPKFRRPIRTDGVHFNIRSDPAK